MSSKILHIDQNAFFASVEMKFDPSLRTVPMAVVGDAELRHGIILAKNALAKSCNIQTGEVIWQARQKCPGLVTVPAHYERYQYYSRKAFDMYCQYTDRVEPYGMDECWLDVSDVPEATDPVRLADELRRRMRDELGLTCSVGASFNKVFAKLGSDYKKPDATTLITPENFRSVVWPLPVSDLLFVGRKTASRLSRINVKTIGSLANLPYEYVRKSFGKNGELLWISANGLDKSPVSRVSDQRIIKSVGNSATTSRDMTSIEDIRQTFFMLADQVASRLRMYGLVGGTVQIHVRDCELRVFERQQRLLASTDYSGEIARVAIDLFRRNYSWERPVRSIGVRATQVSPSATPRQISFFDPDYRIDRHSNLEKTIDILRTRFGGRIIGRGIGLGSHDDLLPDGQYGWNNGGFAKDSTATLDDDCFEA